MNKVAGKYGDVYSQNKQLTVTFYWTKKQILATTGAKHPHNNRLNKRTLIKVVTSKASLDQEPGC